MSSKHREVDAVVTEWDAVDLGDVRLDARVRRVVAALARQPAAGFPAAVETVAEREALYRLLGNRRVTLAKLLAPHVAQTAQRVGALGARPLVVLDKTAFVFGGTQPRAGLTRLGAARQGFDAFVALAVAPSRVPLGVLAVTPLPGGTGRSGPAVWARAVREAAAQLPAAAPIYVMDREADSYALFAALGQGGHDFVVRVAADRWVREHGTAARVWLPTLLAQTPVQVQRTVTLTRRTGPGRAPQARRRHPPRTAREAILTVRACTLVVPRPPKVARTGPATLTLQVVHVVEETPPAGVAPVAWYLITTLPIDTVAAVEAVVDHYRARWTIEEYFKALKTGCAYEQRQLESRATLLTALGLLAPLAWRLLALRTAAATATAAATPLLDADELHVLRHLASDVALGPTPTAAEALLAVARIGGHFPQNGRPGWHVLWTGLRKLRDRVEGYRLAKQEIATGADVAPPRPVRCDQ